MKSADEVFGFSIDYRNSIGKGAFGTVFKCTHPNIQQEICVKVMLDNQSEQIQTDRELSILNEIIKEDNPHLVKIYKCVKENKQIYIFMERCYENLDQLIQRKKQNNQYLSYSEILDYAQQIILGYETLCRRNIIHRDLKPENILIGQDGKLKISDFGLGKFIDHANFLKHTTVGTPLYASPQAILTGDYTNKTDVFSFGALLFYLTYQKPIYENVRNMSILVEQAKNHDKVLVIHKFPNEGDFEEESQLMQLLENTLREREVDRMSWEDLIYYANQQKQNKESKKSIINKSNQNFQSIQQNYILNSQQAFNKPNNQSSNQSQQQYNQYKSQQQKFKDSQPSDSNINQTNKKIKISIREVNVMDTREEQPSQFLRQESQNINKQYQQNNPAFPSIIKFDDVAEISKELGYQPDINNKQYLENNSAFSQINSYVKQENEGEQIFQKFEYQTGINNKQLLENQSAFSQQSQKIKIQDPQPSNSNINQTNQKLKISIREINVMDTQENNPAKNQGQQVKQQFGYSSGINNQQYLENNSAFSQINSYVKQENEGEQIFQKFEYQTGINNKQLLENQSAFSQSSQKMKIQEIGQQNPYKLEQNSENNKKQQTENRQSLSQSKQVIKIENLPYSQEEVTSQSQIYRSIIVSQSNLQNQNDFQNFMIQSQPQPKYEKNYNKEIQNKLSYSLPTNEQNNNQTFNLKKIGKLTKKVEAQNISYPLFLIVEICMEHHQLAQNVLETLEETKLFEQNQDLLSILNFILKIYSNSILSNIKSILHQDKFMNSTELYELIKVFIDTRIIEEYNSNTIPIYQKQREKLDELTTFSNYQRNQAFIQFINYNSNRVNYDRKGLIGIIQNSEDFLYKYRIFLQQYEYYFTVFLKQYQFNFADILTAPLLKFLAYSLRLIGIEKQFSFKDYNKYDPKQVSNLVEDPKIWFDYIQSFEKRIILK